MLVNGSVQRRAEEVLAEVTVAQALYALCPPPSGKAAGEAPPSTDAHRPAPTRAELNACKRSTAGQEVPHLQSQDGTGGTWPRGGDPHTPQHASWSAVTFRTWLHPDCLSSGQLCCQQRVLPLASVLHHPAACQGDFISLVLAGCHGSCTLHCMIPVNPHGLQGAQTGRQALAAVPPGRTAAFCAGGATQLSCCRSGTSGMNSMVSLKCTVVLWCATCCPQCCARHVKHGPAGSLPGTAGLMCSPTSCTELWISQADLAAEPAMQHCCTIAQSLKTVQRKVFSAVHCASSPC